ncbi:helicase-related protein [Pseudonocardia nematodicida]|uniref:Helicase-related protein n=1 Tax=Pseudonocardia nematodicida TaxID=1206997 RepID=A0ABV1KCY0_9PSEU
MSSHVALNDFQVGMTDVDISRMLRKLKERRVLILKAGTGTGKSTFAPFRLMSPPNADDLRLTDYGPIVVTEPRIQAATGVARFVGEKLVIGCPLKECNDPDHGSFNPAAHPDGPDGASGESCDDPVACDRPHVGDHPGPKLASCVVSDCARHIGPGYQVGYQVSEKKHHDPACQLVYVTDGTMVNWITEGRLHGIGTVIVDEAHERNVNIDFILAYLNRELDRYPHLRVIVTSATFDVSFFASYFGEERVHTDEVPAEKSFGYGAPFFASTNGPQEFSCSCEPVREADGSERPAHPPLESYEAWRDQHWPNAPVNGEDLRAVTDSLSALRFSDPQPGAAWRTSMADSVATHVLELVRHLDDHRIHGDVLAFLPSQKLMRTAIEHIESRMDPTRTDLFGLVQAAPLSHKEAALAPRKAGDKRKVVIATSLAETSLTVSGVRFVVDSGLAVKPLYDAETAMADFETGPHSQAGLRQRWGRVGRDAPGWVFPLYSYVDFKKLPENTRSGSTTSNLEQLVVKVKAAGIDDLASLSWPALHDHGHLDDDARSAAKTFRAELVRADKMLRQNGVVNEREQLTRFGKETGRFGAHGTSFGLAVMCADQLACAPEVATALALLDTAHSPRGFEQVKLDNLFLRLPKLPTVATEWALQLERRRAAFAAGDDDIAWVLRVVAAWEQADPSALPWQDSAYRQAFASEFWLNHDMLLQLAELRRSVLAMLSAAMKEEVRRPTNPALAHRVRAAISVGYSQRTCSRVQARTYASDADSAITYVLDKRYDLKDIAGHIIPLGRKAASTSTGRAATTYISSPVAVVPWALDVATNPDPARSKSFELLLRAIEAEDRAAVEQQAVQEQVLAAAIMQYPVGARLRLDHPEGADERTFPSSAVDSVVLCRPPQSPAVSQVPESASSVWATITSTQDDSWPVGRTIAAGEDRSGEPVDTAASDIDPSTGVVVGSEANLSPSATADGTEDMMAVARERQAHVLDKVNLRMDRGALPSGLQPDSYEVVGYNVHARGVDVLLDWTVLNAAFSGDPAVNADLELGSTVEIVAGDVVDVAGRSFQFLHRADGRGRFLVGNFDSKSSATTYQYSLSACRGDAQLIRDLKPGLRLHGEVMPGPAATRAVSLVGHIREQLRNGSRSKTGAGRSNEAIVSARSYKSKAAAFEAEGAGRGEHGEVRVPVPLSNGLLWQTFNVPHNILASAVSETPGQRVDVKLKDGPASISFAIEKAKRGRIQHDVVELRADVRFDIKSEETCSLSSKSCISKRLRDSLVALEPGVAWRDAVWTLYQRSQVLQVRQVQESAKLADEPERQRRVTSAEPRVTERASADGAAAPIRPGLPGPPPPPAAMRPGGGPIRSQEPPADAENFRTPAPAGRPAGSSRPAMPRPRSGNHVLPPEAPPTTRRRSSKRDRRSRLDNPLVPILALFVCMAIVAGVAHMLEQYFANDPSLPAAVDVQSAAAQDEAVVDATIAGSWAAQLASDAGGSEENDARAFEDYSRLREQYGALVVSSDSFAGMLTGRWTVLAPTRFDSSEDALQWCRQRQLPSEACFAHHITRDAADYLGAVYS